MSGVQLGSRSHRNEQLDLSRAVAGTEAHWKLNGNAAASESATRRQNLAEPGLQVVRRARNEARQSSFQQLDLISIIDQSILERRVLAL